MHLAEVQSPVRRTAARPTVIKMDTLFVLIKRWIEVWPFLIPLSIFLFTKKNAKGNILFIFTFISFLISLLANMIWQYSYAFPVSFRNNNILYNLGSISRTVFPAVYLLQIETIKPLKFLRYLLFVYLTFLLINFIFFDSLFLLSTNQHAGESILMLIICIAFFLHLIIDDEIYFNTVKPALILCTGISIYESINFFIYLFFYPVLKTDFKFSTKIYEASQYSFVLYWLMTGLAIYFQSRQPVKTIKPSIA